ncbi:hypothetical protein HDU93_004156 [Gonapodya sp. JEL0774]|nr:hypothetical protein HDU93_004156 [Gonapodya sp. JEL0774]
MPKAHFTARYSRGRGSLMPAAFIVAFTFSIQSSSAAGWFGSKLVNQGPSHDNVQPSTISISDLDVPTSFVAGDTAEDTARVERVVSRLQAIEIQNDDGCFQKVALAMRDQCQKSVDGHNQEANVAIAVAFTACEMSTAGVQLPLECVDATKIGNNPTSPQSKGCVQALSRTPQLWTSYSGYLRDVIQICAALRHPAERQLLAQLYSNISHLNLANHALLSAHHSKLRQIVERAGSELSRTVGGLAEVQATTQRLVLEVKSETVAAHVAPFVTICYVNPTKFLGRVSSQVISVDSTLRAVAESQERARAAIEEMASAAEKHAREAERSASLAIEELGRSSHETQLAHLAELNSLVEAQIDAQQHLKLDMEVLEAHHLSLSTRWATIFSQAELDLAALRRETTTEVEHLLSAAREARQEREQGLILKLNEGQIWTIPYQILCFVAVIGFSFAAINAAAARALRWAMFSFAIAVLVRVATTQSLLQVVSSLPIALGLSMSIWVTAFAAGFYHPASQIQTPTSYRVSGMEYDRQISRIEARLEQVLAIVSRLETGKKKMDSVKKVGSVGSSLVDLEVEKTSVAVRPKRIRRN